MKHLSKVFLILSIALVLSCAKTEPAEEIPNLGGWDYEWMKKVKSDLNENGGTFNPAFEQLILDANEALNSGPFSVTYKNLVPPSGSKHDYMSMRPYWWPDPEKEDGLPYIRRDGEVNPERNNTDSPQFGGLVENVRILSQAWFFSDNLEFATKAAELLRVWFLDPETLMNPHLEYAQAIPGITPGRFIGVIDAAKLHTLVDAIALLEISGAISADEIAGLKSWFKRYFSWLTESEHGKNEEAYHNNHSVAYDMQACGIAYYIGDTDYVARKAREVPRRRIDPMIEEDGSQPFELIRTKAFGYSVHNLNNFFNVGEKGVKVGVNYFAYKNVKGGSMQKALDYLVQYIGKENEWPYEQIASWENTENDLGLIVRRAALHFENENYEQIWKETFFPRLKTNWNLLVVPGPELKE